MKHKTLFLFTRRLLLLVCLALAGTGAATAYDYTGTVNLSDIESGRRNDITRFVNCTLNVDVDKTLHQNLRFAGDCKIVGDKTLSVDWKVDYDLDYTIRTGAIIVENGSKLSIQTNVYVHAYGNFEKSGVFDTYFDILPAGIYVKGETSSLDIEKYGSLGVDSRGTGIWLNDGATLNVYGTLLANNNTKSTKKKWGTNPWAAIKTSGYSTKTGAGCVLNFHKGSVSLISSREEYGILGNYATVNCEGEVEIEMKAKINKSLAFFCGRECNISNGGRIKVKNSFYGGNGSKIHHLNITGHDSYFSTSGYKALEIIDQTLEAPVDITSPPLYSQLGNVIRDTIRLDSTSNYLTYVNPTYNNNPIPVVIISALPFTGTVDLSATMVLPGQRVIGSLTGNIGELYTKYPDLVNLMWTREKGDDQPEIVAQGTPFYQAKESDVGYYLRLTARPTYTGGFVQSDMALVTKNPCTTDVVAPVLANTNDKLMLTNPKTNQEYIVLTYKKTTFTESDWASSRKPTSTTALDLNGTIGNTYYVYTRVRETTTTFAGEAVAEGMLYFGSTTYTTGITVTPKLQAKSTNPTTGRTIYLYTTLNRDNNECYIGVDDVVQLTAAPIPADATNFRGIAASSWYNNSGNGTYYSNAACTQTLTSGEYYTVVYYKPAKEQNYVELSAEYTLGYNNVVRDAFYVHIGSTRTTVPPTSINVGTITLDRGQSISDMTIPNVHPAKASLSGLTISFASGAGTAPLVTTTRYLNGRVTLNINAKSATAGKYNYDLLINDAKVGSLTVEVKGTEVQEISVYPSELTTDRGMTHDLSAAVIPTKAAADGITWSSSDTNVATVDQDGKVTISSNAEIGATATITATCGGKEATCEITIAGEVFNIRVGGVQVTTRNMDKETLTDEVVTACDDDEMTERYFEGNMSIEYTGDELILNNAIIKPKTESGIVIFTQDQEVTVIGDNRIEPLNGSAYGISIRNRNSTTTFRGNGTLSVKGSYGIALRSLGTNETIIADSITIIADGTTAGIWVPENAPASVFSTLTVRGKGTKVMARGTEGSMRYMHAINLEDGLTFMQPEGAFFNADAREVQDANGNLVTDWVIIAAPAGLTGDVNQDGAVNGADVTALYNYILNGDTTFVATSDVNGDGAINGGDVTAVYNIILGL